MLKDMGNAVMVMGRVIPAVNIQVEGVPGYLEHPTGPPAWYGIYFEIIFENGDLWVVEKGADRDFLPDYVQVSVYSDFTNKSQSEAPDFKIYCPTWGLFLESYDEERKRVMA